MITSRMSHPSAPHTLRRFFDRVVHRSFGDLAFGGDPAAAYLADLLTRFARTENLYPTGALPGERLESVAYTLFMTGLFRERVERMSVTSFYIREGQRSYRFEGYASALHYMRKVYFRPEHGPPDLPFFRRLVTEW